MTRQEIRDLNELLRLVKMENASFGMPYEFVIVNKGGGAEDALPIPVTDFVKERTRLWRQSWLLPIIERLLSKYDKEHAPEDYLPAHPEHHG